MLHTNCSLLLTCCIYMCLWKAKRTETVYGNSFLIFNFPHAFCWLYKVWKPLLKTAWCEHKAWLNQDCLNVWKTESSFWNRSNTGSFFTKVSAVQHGIIIIFAAVPATAECLEILNLWSVSYVRYFVLALIFKPDGERLAISRLCL